MEIRVEGECSVWMSKLKVSGVVKQVQTLEFRTTKGLVHMVVCRLCNMKEVW